MGDITPPSGNAEIDTIDLRTALEERYLAYALSTIMHRALPDVRDGLKPVHRRVLYAMRMLRLDPNTAFKKCARVVGDVIGKYHPHGDQSVYDAMVRLAQDFAQRYPLVDGQGNFGNIDGDNAAAMRYTEARMTAVAQLLLEGLDENAVDFRDNYDGSEEEPVVLPAAFPNLLANGSSGIAVGMATNVPPHNVSEICDAALMLLDNPHATVGDLMAHVKGPDFPTGGIIVDDSATIQLAYETGRGAFRVRARWHKEDAGRGNWVIVVTEIPYVVQKARLIEKLAELITTKKVPLLEDVRDESTDVIRLVLEPKNKTVDPDILMASLFRTSELECRFNLNMNVLDKGIIPRVMPLNEVIQAWLNHRREVLIRRSQHRLDEIIRRLHLLEGLLIAYLNLDEVIRIIREEDEPKPVLMKRFDLSEIQAEAILNMRLRNLRKLEEMKLRGEHADLIIERDQIQALLASTAQQWKVIAYQVKDLRKRFGIETPLGKRRTTFEQAQDHAHDDIREAMVEREPITVVLSEKAWIRALKGHVSDVSSLTFKTDDSLSLHFHAETTDKILLFASNGKFYTLTGDKLPGGRGAGEPLRLHIELENTANIIAAFVHKPGRKLVVATGDARGFVVDEAEVIANTRKGKQVLNVDEGGSAKIVVPVEGDMVAVLGDNRKLLLFPVTQIPEMPRGKGVRLQKYKEGGLAGLKTFDKAAGIQVEDVQGRTISLKDEADYYGDRAAAGKLLAKHVRGV